MMTDNHSEKILLAKAKDVVRLSEKHYCAKNTDFLTPSEAAAIRKENIFSLESKQEFFGGYEDAERVMFVSYPDYMEDFERSELISALKITGRDIESLSHRDFLGSILGLGIKREKIGDIVVSEGAVYVFAAADIADYVKENLTKIGRCGIKIETEENLAALHFEKKTEEIRGTVQSLRLDAVLSVALKTSRSKVMQYIESERVNVNWQTVSSGAFSLKEGDVLSVRGFGRFKVFEIGGITKKGRIGITVLKYI